ncbi:MAG: phosphoribosylformylglycinamidine synthase subunit PurL [Phycisphaerales bacterium]|nr:phosphoribosylformylglycinamidine synthase subunit PurL [Planctomycetota bacterium]MCH8509135.1 phosphoribosylformylglycinamidine synthase subunit PurL [Phycisphaerales bacterium]
MPSTAARPAVAVHRVEVRPLPNAGDPRADELMDKVRGLGLNPESVRTARVYLIEGPFEDADIHRIVGALLTNPVTEEAVVGAAPADGALVEIHPLPGVMDPPAQTVRDAIEELTGLDCRVLTGWRYDLRGVSGDDAANLAAKVLANPVVTGVHTEAFHPAELPKGHAYDLAVRHVKVRDLDDATLEKLSRDAHLFLSLDEMRAIRDEYRHLDREPSDIELETLAQTWSEHCVHKTLKATIRYQSDDPEDPVKRAGRPGHQANPDGSVTIHNLLKSSVAAATFELIEEGLDWTLSVFVDNAGIIAFDDDHAVCIKVETHNHPSAIEPYGGAATGIGGCIRDIMGTGLAAKPIANTDVFCVAHPDIPQIPAGCLPPDRVLREVVAGVRDYGNRMGIPTVNGAVWFDDRHIGNPLVFAGCIGVMPNDRIGGEAKPGDLIVALGGRTGRDGIHGATFSSAELTDTHADEFAHAVQIGNAIEEKRVLDAILRARDHKKSGAPAAGCLYSAITDCGAGGFSSAVGEMGEKLGAEVHLEKAPLKYEGLSYTEIWISEAQERMVLALPRENLDALQAICDEEHVELSVLGTFGTENRDLILTYHGTEVGRLPMEFLHDGIPMPTREANWSAPKTSPERERAGSPPTPSLRNSVSSSLLALLAHPNIASKHWIINQYDHEVQGNTVVKPLVGPLGRGPSDAAVIEPIPGSGRGLAIACGLATGLESDPYHMALAAIDECVRNLVCTGADPDRIAILDNFSWPSCNKPENLGSLVRAAEGCYDGAKAYRTPFVSGKDSLNNQFTTEDGRTIEIPPTLLITGIGLVHELTRVVTMDAKKPGHALFLIGGRETGLGGSHFARLTGVGGEEPRVDLAAGPRHARFVADLIRQGRIRSAHDVSDGGALTAIAEMLIAGSRPDRPIGAEVSLSGGPGSLLSNCFAEMTSAYIVEVDEDAFDLIGYMAEQRTDIPVHRLGELTDTGTLLIEDGPQGEESIEVERLAETWRAPLDW